MDGAEPAVHAPTRLDPVARAGSALIGGPAGSRLASAVGFWRAGSVLVLLSGAALSAALLAKQHCRAQGWSSPDQFWHACYSDIPVLYGSASLGADVRPGLGQSLSAGGLGQPPLAGALMWITSAFVPNTGSSAPRQFFDLSAVLLAVLLAFAVAALCQAAGRRPWDAAHLAISPVLVAAGLISYELLAVAFTAAGFLALVRRRQVLAGVMFGFAVCAAPQLWIVVLAVLLVLRRGGYGGVPALAGSAVGAWLAVRIVLLPGLAGGLGGAVASWRAAIPGYGSLWLVPQLLRDSRPDQATTSLGRLVQGLSSWAFQVQALGATSTSILAAGTLFVLVAGVLWLALVEQPGPFDVDPVRCAPLALALLAAVLLTDKSLPVQASLLLLPLIALSGLRWRDHLIWAGTELVYFVGIWLYIAAETTPDRGLPAAFYLVMLVARLAGIGWIGICGLQAHRSSWAQTRAEGPDCGQISVEVAGPGRLPEDRLAAAWRDADRRNSPPVTEIP